jgi:signal transduction histidine kinase
MMKMPRFELTPSWIMYDQFWSALKQRNLWLIYLRYIAVFMLASVLGGSAFLTYIHVEVVPIAAIAFVILLYNAAFHALHGKLPEGYAKFHGLHFALLQMCADFIALLGLIYCTGGAESPFYFLFIFHVIIGSLLLPASIIFLLITATLVVAFTGAIFEATGVIPHIAITGLLSEHIYKNSTYIIFNYSVFAVTLYVANYLVNSISSELYRREKALTIAYKQLEEAERTKSRYVMSVVHDLKTPIAAAMTYLNMMSDGSLGQIPESFERPLERSRVRLTNAITVINDILQLTHLKLASKPEVSDVNLGALIEDIYEDMRIIFVSKRIRFSTWMNAESDIMIEAEPKLLRLAIANVISNTYKYTGENGSVEVHINQPGDQIRIEIADNGIGIPEAEQKKIFDDFYRSTLTKKMGIEGTGLGMSIVTQIVKQLHGTITVESPSRLASGDDRPGTAFTISLPKKFIDKDTSQES